MDRLIRNRVWERAASGQLTRLFRPRQDRWLEHFFWHGPVLTPFHFRVARGEAAIRENTVAIGISESLAQQDIRTDIQTGEEPEIFLTSSFTEKASTATMRSLICFGRFVVAAVFCGSVISSEFLPAGETKELNRPAHQIVCSGADAGGYAAFPDICRTTEGDLICVFYSGYGHVSVPNEKWPNGGRIMAVRSTNGGLNWGEPFVISDTLHDDRDPHIALLSNGALICNWFIAVNPARPRSDGRRHAMYLSRSSDNGQSWSNPEEIRIESADWYVCSAPVRELSDGSLILGLYTETAETNRVFGATIRSHDRGQSWTDLATIGENSGLYLDAETDVIPLADGTLLAALRSSKTDLYFSTSRDSGKTWSEVRSSGFRGHCPHFLRHSSGTLLLTHRLPATALHWSNDDGKTWQGPLKLDDVSGAYPGCVELPGGRVFCVYYEEGEGSGIRGIRLNVTREGVEIEAGSPAP